MVLPLFGTMQWRELQLICRGLMYRGMPTVVSQLGYITLPRNAMAQLTSRAIALCHSTIDTCTNAKIQPCLISLRSRHVIKTQPSLYASTTCISTFVNPIGTSPGNALNGSYHQISTPLAFLTFPTYVLDRGLVPIQPVHQQHPAPDGQPRIEQLPRVRPQAPR